MTSDPDDLKRRLAASIERAEQRIRALDEGEQITSVVTAEAEAADGAVRATVTGSGRLHELTLDERVRHWAPEEIARQVVHCVQRAQSRLAEVAVESLTERAGADLPFAGLAAERLRTEFPSPESDIGAEPAHLASRRNDNDIVVKLATWDQDD
ncbi:hypothetical protein GCM10022222_45710 [Amycolatopsis ultiminotia]|uniref:YbaB/EbfC DNA-binding family protein n=1 Tax=Amycolatopsis ultiminotia TaxID=543629 RepID=A0ABP6WUU8_9PSEU